MTNASNPVLSTIDAAEAAHFGAMADDWWDPEGSSAMLHRLMPARMRYVRTQIDRHFGTASTDRHPLADRHVLDVGCGAGLVSEPLARLGGQVTAIDAAPANIAAARAHAAGQGLAIDYRACGVEDVGETGFDLIISLEVIEHVADPAGFIGALAARLAPGGLLLLSTPNRTMLSRVLLVGLGETIGGIPPGTHDWDKFLQPQELQSLLKAAGLAVTDVTGLSYDPARGFVTGRDRSLNYLLAATRSDTDQAPRA